MLFGILENSIPNPLNMSFCLETMMCSPLFFYIIPQLKLDTKRIIFCLQNFHAESNAPTILKAMQKETLIAQNIQVDNDAKSFFNKDQIQISPHPNIVKIYTAFTDMVPAISDSMDLYPDALPSRYASFLAMCGLFEKSPFASDHPVHYTQV